MLRAAYLPANAVVVDPHAGMDIARRGLAGVQPIAGEALAEAGVVTAPPPLPGVLQRRGRGLLLERAQ